MHHSVFGQPVVRAEAVALEHVRGVLYMNKTRCIEQVFALVPEELLSLKQVFRGARNLHTAVEAPQALVL